MRSIFIALTVIQVILILKVLDLWAQDEIPQDSTYHLEADEIFGTDNVSFTARGNVSVKFKNSVITADEATYFPQTKHLVATGNITVKDDLQELRADKIIYDLNSETGNINNVTGIINGEYYICARKMDRIDKEYYIMEGVRITTCNSPLPEWSFSFHRAEAEINGYIFGDHATGNIKDFPILYTPKLIYPLKIDRQTGFLIPSIGYSTELGTFIRENFFWAIRYDMDMTVGANAFTNRGAQGLVEARYAITPNSNVYLTADGINDAESSVLLEKRWRYISKSTVQLPGNIEILADAFKVSDYMYMRDFGDMGLYKGIHGDNNNYYQQYHMKWTHPWLEAIARYRADELYTDRQTGYTYTLTERKPSLSLQKNRLNLNVLNVDYLASWENVRYLVQYNYFTRPTVEREYNYSRFFGRTAIYRTFNLPVLRFTPRLIGTYTHWQDFDYVPRVNPRSPSDFTFLRASGNGYDRAIPTVILRTDINEVYKTFPGGARHGILNIFQYTFTQNLNQTGLPNYIANDTIERRNDISWTLRNYLRFASRWQADLTATQAVDIDTDQAFLPLVIRSSVAKASVFSNVFQLKYDYYASDNVTYKTSDRFIVLQDILTWHIGPLSVNGSYSYDKIYTEDYNTSLQLGASALISNIMMESLIRWQAENEILSLAGLEPVENKISIKWIDQCWSLGLAYSTYKYTDVRPTGRQPKRDYMIELSLELRGIGESSTGIYKDTTEYDN